MDYSDVIKALKEGKKIRTTDMNPGVYIQIQNVPGSDHKIWINDPMLRRPVEFNFCECEIFSENWEILEDIPEVKLHIKKYFTCPKCGHVNMDMNIDNNSSACKECGTKVKLLPKRDEQNVDYTEILSKYREWLKEIISGLNSMVWAADYTKAEYIRYSRDLVQTCLDNFKKLELEVLDQQRKDTN